MPSFESPYLDTEDGYRTPTIDDINTPLQGSRMRQLPERGGSLIVPSYPSQTSRPSLPAYGEDDDVEMKETEGSKLSWRERIKHFTWAYFTLSMATGGVANVIHAIPFQSHGLNSLGYFFFIINILIFFCIVSMITLRFALHPGTLRESFIHPSESLFIPASVVSFGIILMNLSQYGMPLNTALIALFWIDCALAMVASVVIYLVLWSTQTFTVAAMTPIWIFPAYPLLIIGPHAGILSGTASPKNSLDIIIGGTILQAIGFMVSLMVYSAFIYRLMTQKLPKQALRPAMFVSVGPSAFTVTGLVTMAKNLSRSVPANFMEDGPRAAFILRVMADWAGLWLYGLALWFFFVSVGAHYSCVRRGKLDFAMTWFSFVFPNSALITATLAIGSEFGSREIQILGTIMAALLIIVWIVVVGMMIRAVKLKQILWPQKGEDKDEGGFRSGCM